MVPVDDRSIHRVLVADSQCEWLVGVAQGLDRTSVTIRVATSDRQTLQIVRNERLALAVVAGDMPRWGGLDLVRRVHQISIDLPVVLIGGRYDRHWLEEALRLGALTVLPRPVSPSMVLAMILKTLRMVRPPDWPREPGVN